MQIIGLTGPSGAGKGEVSRLLSKRGFEIIDADAVYHGILVPPSDCLDELVKIFGQGILAIDQTLDRAALASLVFGEENKERLELLNKTTHKYVLEQIRVSVDALRASECRACVIDAPLLFESGLDKDCDFVISVTADKNVRADRIAHRDSISLERAYLRLNSQKDDLFYESSSDYCIKNNGDLGSLARDVENILFERGIKA